SRWHIMIRYKMEGAGLTPVNGAEFGLANTYGFLQHGSEHRLKIIRRTADNLEHFGSGRLLLQRLGQVGRALAQFVEQPRILVGRNPLPLKCLVTLASEPRDLCFLAGNGRTARARVRRNATLVRPRLATVRFCG